MKKTIALLLCFMTMLINPAFALVHDDFVEQTLDKNLKTKAYVKQEIKDDLIDTDFINKYSKEISIKSVYIPDAFANETLKKYENINLNQYKPCDFQNLQYITLKIKPLKKFSTRNYRLKEGSLIEFVTVEDKTIDDITYKKGTPIVGVIETISLNQAFGTPASVALGKFNIDNNILDASLISKGANRAAWVLPTGYVLTCFFGVGLLFFPIRGGHAKLNPHKVYKLVIKDL